MTQDAFDVTALGEQPNNSGVLRQLGHSYGFIYRQILRASRCRLSRSSSTHYPPNQPTAKRCFDFGRAIARAVKAWHGGERVAIVASGGVSHFVIDEAFDWRLLNAMKQRNYQVLIEEPEVHFRSGTSETKNWLVVHGCRDRLGYGAAGLCALLPLRSRHR